MNRWNMTSRVARRLAFLCSGSILLQQVGCEAIPASLTAGVLSSISNQVIGNAFSIWLGLGPLQQSFF